MSGLKGIGCGASGVRAAPLLLVLAVLSACTNSDRLGGGQPETSVTPPPISPTTTAAAPPAPDQPPPVDLAGRWRLSAASGGACLMTLTAEPQATDGKIAPAGGCPGNFFMSRKWTFEHDTLMIRDHKGQELVELTFASGQFEGKDASGGAITLARP
jgi:Protease inhibitor Inh